MKPNTIPLLLIAILSIFLTDCAKHPSTAFEENGLYGYKDKEGKVAISPQYSVAYDFQETGIAFAFGKGGWICIDSKNRELLHPFPFDNGPDDFSEHKARFVENGKIGFFDPFCKKVIPADFDFAFPFEKGYSVICSGCKSVREPDGEHSILEGGKYGLIDSKGKIVVNPEYDSVYDADPEKKIVTVKKDGTKKELSLP
ncbi:WG repeat-containing protein [Leptospira wolffii]|uniref:WG repeat-containing protein n=1 Tax=Leptospira wolffii TaxID=409998 RepID=A0ABV5BUB3_9LEPT